MQRGENNNDQDRARELSVGLVGYWRNVCRTDPIGKAAEAAGVGRWQLWAVYHGRRKVIPARLLEALRREYLRICELQVRQLEAQLEDLKRESGEDDFTTSIGAEASRLVAKLKASRERAR